MPLKALRPAPELALPSSNAFKNTNVCTYVGVGVGVGVSTRARSIWSYSVKKAPRVPLSAQIYINFFSQLDRHTKAIKAMQMCCNHHGEA